MLLKPRKRVSMTWPLEKLSPHKKQSLYFAAHTREKLEDLQRDIEQNGMREPIEVTPKGRIISGHGRYQAAINLGWTEVPVVIRYDLAAKGPKAIEQRLIEANLNRRHLSKLELARLYAALRELEPQGNERRGQGKLRDRIGARLGLSGRQLDRMLELLDLPVELQRAVEARQIPARAALHIAKLPEELLAQVLETIRRGENPRHIVARLRALNPLPTTRRDDQVARDIRDWLRLSNTLLDNVEEVSTAILPQQRQRLSEVEKLISLLKGERP